MGYYRQTHIWTIHGLACLQATQSVVDQAAKLTQHARYSSEPGGTAPFGLQAEMRPAESSRHSTVEDLLHICSSVTVVLSGIYCSPLILLKCHLGRHLPPLSSSTAIAATQTISYHAAYAVSQASYLVQVAYSDLQVCLT